ncbi:MAG: hypothetical protein AAF915_27700 [Cyanobacteria bacterium P01_D01_bin.50]
MRFPVRPEAKRIATLLAFTHELEYTATDDVIDLLNLFIRGLLTKSKREGEQERLRTLKDLDAAALRLVEAAEVILDTDTEDIDLREEAYKRVSCIAISRISSPCKNAGSSEFR